MELLRTKMCDDKPMICLDNNCYYKIDPVYTFYWLSWREFKSVQCTIFQQVISGSHLNSTLHTGATSSCKALDYYCLLGYNVAIWTRDVIHFCPYNYIETIEFNVQNDVYFSDAAHLAFRGVSKVVDCGFELIETAEGIYLSTNDTVKGFIDESIDINKIDDLILSELDYNQYTSEFLSYQILNKMMCVLFRVQILMNMRTSNGFFRVLIFENEFILFNDRGRLLIPTCVEIDSIKLVTQTDSCYEFVPVHFIYNGVDQFAFLDDNGILSKTSVKRNCSYDKYIRVYNMDYYVELIGFSNTLQHMSNVESSKVHLRSFNMAKLNFHHDVKILEGVDLISSLKLLNRIEEFEHVVYIQDNVNNKKSDIEPVVLNQEVVWLKTVSSYLNFDEIGKKIKNVLIVIFSVFIFVFIILTYFYILKPIFFKLKLCRLNYRKKEFVNLGVQSENHPLTVITSMDEIHPIGIRSQTRNVTAYLEEIKNSQV
jgi:hypothetical protein